MYDNRNLPGTVHDGLRKGVRDVQALYPLTYDVIGFEAFRVDVGVVVAAEEPLIVSVRRESCRCEYSAQLTFAGAALLFAVHSGNPSLLLYRL